MAESAKGRWLGIASTLALVVARRSDAAAGPSRWKPAWIVGKRAGFLFVGTLLVLSTLLGLFADNAIYPVLVFVAPLTYLLAAAPLLFRRRRA